MPFYAKLWTDILGDEKLMRAARKGSKQLVILPWLFAFAKKVDDNGRLTVDGEPAEPDDIAAQIPGVSPKQVAQCLEELERIKVLVRGDDDVLCLASWEQRSGTGSKPSDAPESVADRVRKHRLKKRQAARGESNETPYIDDGDTPVTRSETPPVTRNETPDVTPRNASETSYARSRDVEEEEDREIDRDREQEEEEETTSSTSPTRASPFRARLVSPAHRSAFDRMTATVPSPDTWIAEMSARMDGMHGPQLSAQQLGESLSDYVANGNLARPNFKHFRGYLDNAAKQPDATPRSPNGAQVRPGIGARAAAVTFDAIKDMP